MTNDATLQSVLRNRDEIEAVEATINKIDEAIDETQEKILSETVPGREDLDRQREDLLAGIAVGTADEGDLSAIDAEIAAHAEASAAADRKIGPLRQAVEGLQRRRQQQQETLRKLLQTRESLRHAFLLVQEEQAGVRVRELADALHEAFGKLIAIGMLSGSKIVSQSTPYTFPNLRLQAFRDVGDRPYLHVMDEIAGPGKADDLLRSEKARLRELGVEIE